MKVAIIEETSAYKLQIAINNRIERTSDYTEIIDIQYSMSRTDRVSDRYSAMIVYRIK